jgi:hypothetical protein
MGEYYVLDRLIVRGDLFIEDYKADQAYDQQVLEGVHIEAQGPIQLFYKHMSKRKVDYLSGVYFFPVISARFKTLLLAEKVTHLEFCPVQLIHTKTQEIDNTYSFLNILDNVLCLDREASEYEVFPGSDEVISIEKLVLEEEKLRGRDLVRLHESPVTILVSPRLRNAIEAAGLTGIKLVAVDDYHDEI